MRIGGRQSPGSTVLWAVFSGTVAAATSTLALGVAALAEGKGAAQPVNATSHWLYDDRAADFRKADFDHTVIGLGTHYAATIFWALFFETWMAKGGRVGIRGAAARAVVTAGAAALVDYTITPKRFTPGWEFVLSKRSMALVYLAMGMGFAGSRRILRGPK